MDVTYLQALKLRLRLRKCLKDFRRNDQNFIFNFGHFTEGFDRCEKSNEHRSVSVSMFDLLCVAVWVIVPRFKFQISLLCINKLDSMPFDDR